MRRGSKLDGITDVDSALARDSVRTAAPAAEADTAEGASWIPRPPEELESADLLEFRDGVRGVGILAGSRDGRHRIRRAWIRSRLPFGKLESELAWLPRADHASWGTIRLADGRAEVVGGAVVARRVPVLLAEALGLTRSVRAPLSPRVTLGGFEAPRGATSLAVRGAGVRAGSDFAAGWCLTGRDETGASLVTGGLAVSRPRVSVGASVGSRTSRSPLRVVSLTGRAGPSSGWVSGELLASASRGPAFLCETACRSGPVLAAARWRRRPGEERPVAGELTLEAGSRRSRSAALTRLTWTAWSSRAASDDGRLELETVVRRRSERAGSVRVRIGGRPGGERYVLADLEVAREAGRSFTLIASRRERPGAGATSVGSTWGGRFDWSTARAGGTLFLQATRVSAGDGVASWAAAIAPSGDESLVARGRAGVAVTGRAWLHVGALQVEGLLSDAGSSGADPPMRGTLRLEWARDD